MHVSTYRAFAGLLAAGLLGTTAVASPLTEDFESYSISGDGLVTQSSGKWTLITGAEDNTTTTFTVAGDPATGGTHGNVLDVHRYNTVLTVKANAGISLTSDETINYSVDIFRSGSTAGGKLTLEANGNGKALMSINTFGSTVFYGTANGSNWTSNTSTATLGANTWTTLDVTVHLTPTGTFYDATLTPEGGSTTTIVSNAPATLGTDRTWADFKAMVYGAAGTGQDFYYDNFQLTVPEPAAVVLLGLSATGTLLARRRAVRA